MNLFRTLWQDERGIVLSTELILMATILIMGSITGLVVFRDHVVQEFGDVGAAVNALNQSFDLGLLSSNNPLFPFITDCGCAESPTAVVAWDLTYFGISATSFGFGYIDETDFCEATDPQAPTGDSPACIDLNQPAINEGTVL